MAAAEQIISDMLNNFVLIKNPSIDFDSMNFKLRMEVVGTWNSTLVVLTFQLY